MPLADTLLRLAAGPRLFSPRWSGQILGEVSRTLQEKFGLSHEKALYRESEIRRHFPEAWIEGFDHLIPSMTNHPKDRHVLAAAAHARASILVTYNVKDFPPASLAPYSLTALGPSTFLSELFCSDPSPVLESLSAQAAAIGQTLRYLLSRLQVNVPSFVEAIVADDVLRAEDREK